MTGTTNNDRQVPGGLAPGFSLPLLDGSGTRTLHDYLSGKAGAVIVFWSSMCAHCARYDGYFNSFSTMRPWLGFTTIASRYGETTQQIRIAVKDRRLSFPILLDSSGAVARQWHAQQTPRCYLVSPDGRFLYRGAVDNFKMPDDDAYVPYLEPAIDSLLAGHPIPRMETASFGCAIETVYYRLPKQL